MSSTYSDTTETYSRQFLDGENVILPEEREPVQDAVIAEATRHALASELRRTTEDEPTAEYPRVHVLSLRSWVVNKLASILGEPNTESDDPDWFRKVLKEGSGPTLTFLGDLLELEQGYYAPSPTRAVMSTDSEAILISADPTSYFTSQGLTIEHKGVPRHIVDTSRDEIVAAGIPIQDIDTYVGLDSIKTFGEEVFLNWQETQEFSAWNPSSDWDAYYTKRYGFGWGNSATVAPVAGQLWSLYRDTTEYGSRDYWWKIQGHNDADGPVKLRIPNRYWKQFALFLDSVAETERTVKIIEKESEVAIQCPFIPTAAQIRWLHAIGAEYDRFVDHGLQWRFSPEHLDKTKEVFSGLAVELTD